MIWIKEHKRRWRTAVLILLFISITGPWTFDLIHVPAEYACSLPNYRLEGDFCGIPFSALGILPLSIGSLLRLISQLITGATALSDVSLELLINISYLLLFLPLLTTVLMIFRGGHQSKFAVVSWGLAAGIALFFGVSFLSRPHPELWHVWLFRGVWFYSGISIMALLLELTMLAADKPAVS